MKQLLAGALWLAFGVAFAAEDNTAAYQRIDAERAGATAAFDAEDADCTQRFAVSGCLKNVQSRRRAKLAELRRQESALREADLASQAQEQRQSAAQKALEHQQWDAEQGTNNAAAHADEKLREQDQKRAAHAARASGPAAQPASIPRTSGPTPAEQAANRASYARKQQEAEKKRQELARRMADKTGKPAAPLPLPPPITATK
jgi:colicin import membrane protein